MRYAHSALLALLMVCVPGALGNVAGAEGSAKCVATEGSSTTTRVPSAAVKVVFPLYPEIAVNA